jgi:hypothetical protein
MAIIRVPSALRTIASATAEHPWREPGFRCWWAFVHDDTRDEIAARPRPAADVRTGDELRLLSIIVASARPVPIDELVRAFPGTAEPTEAIIERLRDRGLVVTPRRSIGRVVAPTPRGRAARIA